mmetsp:Transcript_18719/g.37533  ORF Transcript_18719/g.37533 Transcript_18719/m.37533 type:complete len:119 (-) Transcript_18719:1461-1817(-)
MISRLLASDLWQMSERSLNIREVLQTGHMILQVSLLPSSSSAIQLSRFIHAKYRFCHDGLKNDPAQYADAQYGFTARQTSSSVYPELIQIVIWCLHAHHILMQLTCEGKDEKLSMASH